MKVYNIMLDLRLLNSFIQAARTESFTAAGRALQLSPAAVSQNIKHLESQLGARLFTRTTRMVKLTPEGRQFLARCAPAMAALDDAVRAVGDEAERIEGHLRVSTTSAFGRRQLMPLVVRFMTKHPTVTVELDLSDHFVDLVADEFDLAIRVGTLPENDYIARLLLPVTPVLCAAPAYLARHGRPTTVADLARHRTIGMRSGNARRVFAWEFNVGGERVHHDVDAALIVNEAEAVAIAAEAGLGIAQLGSFLVEEHIAAGRLEVLLEALVPRPRGVYAVYPTRRYTPQRTKALIEFLARELKAAPIAVPG